MKLIQLTEKGGKSPTPIWINPHYIVEMHESDYGYTQIRFTSGHVSRVVESVVTIRMRITNVGEL